MTRADAPPLTHPTVVAVPPLSRAARLAAATSLALGSALVALPQYVEHLRAGDLERLEQIEWGLAHLDFYRVEWVAAMIGSFLLLLGFLGLWERTRWRAPRLTAIGAVVLTWGMSGQVFSDVATFTAQVVTADVLGADRAEQVISKGYLSDPGMVGAVLAPVIAGMLIGVLLLAAACWVGGLPRPAVVLLALWPLWDFFGPGPVGFLTADLLLLTSGLWLGAALARGASAPSGEGG